MALPNNYKNFPENVEPPEKVEGDDTELTIHGYRFRGLQDFYDFLKRNPKINVDTFGPERRVSSIEGSYDFAGIPYDDAIEKLVQEMDPGYQEYLTIQKKINARRGQVHKYQQVKTIAGGVVDPVAYTTGSPEIYRASRLVKQPKFITIDTQVAYNCGTSKSQVFNRALIITNLVKALERNGYNVDVNSFMVAQEYDEVIKAVFEIKKHGQRVNYQTLYKSLVDVEFFRRLCFRIIEISDVVNGWRSGYGHPADFDLVRKLLKLKKDDIYFDQPSNMGIRGESIETDFERAIKNLHLEKSIDVEREKKYLRESIKVLRK